MIGFRTGAASPRSPDWAPFGSVEASLGDDDDDAEGGPASLDSCKREKDVWW